MVFINSVLISLALILMFSVPVRAQKNQPKSQPNIELKKSQPLLTQPPEEKTTEVDEDAAVSEELQQSGMGDEKIPATTEENSTDQNSTDQNSTVELTPTEDNQPEANQAETPPEEKIEELPQDKNVLTDGKTLEIETAEQAAIREAKEKEAKMNKSAEVDYGTGHLPPKGPKRKFVPKNLGDAGGQYRTYHPDAAHGLLRIESDGAYQYRVESRKKTSAYNFRIGQISPPSITGSSGRTTYKGVYGNQTLSTVFGDYEYYPFQKYGALGLQFGAGFTTVNGNGVLDDGANSKALETYKLYVIPISANVVYRLEFWRRQFLVPYVVGGITLFGLAETRDDNRKPIFASSAAAGGGGGILFNISRWDPHGAFVMSRDYGVSDLWLTADVRYLQGLKKNIDFTSSILSVGITVDY